MALVIRTAGSREGFYAIFRFKIPHPSLDVFRELSRALVPTDHALE